MIRRNKIDDAEVFRNGIWTWFPKEIADYIRVLEAERDQLRAERDDLLAQGFALLNGQARLAEAGAAK